MKYRWLHISDLHSVCTGIKTVIMQNALIDEIKDLNQQKSFTFLLITGDISDKNQGYDQAKQLINEIIRAIGLGLDKVFIIPGNHDLDRKIPLDREEKINECWMKDLLDSDEKDYIGALLPAQADFFNAYEDILGRKYNKDNIHFHIDVDDNLSVVHLNTSWMCYDSNNESGKLHIGLHSLYQCLNNKELESKPIKIAIGHHRMSDFNSSVETSIKSLFKYKDIDLYLGGHCHDSTVIYDPQIDTEFCSCRQARAEDNDYPAGFIVGDINTTDDQSSFQFYSWNSKINTWMYDYTVNPAKHGKYYLRGEKFTIEPEVNRDIIVDIKIFNLPLDRQMIMKQFNINGAAIFGTSIRDIRPETEEQWRECLQEIKNLYYAIVKDSNKEIHVFPLASIPLLVAFGYLLQNNKPNINIYQYNENKSEWCLDEDADNIPVNSSIQINESKKLALALSISGDVKDEDIKEVLEEDYDLLRVGINEPRFSVLNYKDDVLAVKNAIKENLDRYYSNYDEIHLFLAAPAGLCIEVGRIIRKSTYPNTYIYNYNRRDDIKYTKIFNLTDI